MPMYRYRCTGCGAREEHLQKISDPPVEICSSCGGALAKQMTAAAFHLKGGGWYKDLYASSKPGDSGSSSDSTSTASSSSSGSSSESSSKSDATPSSTPTTTTTTSTASSSAA